MPDGSMIIGYFLNAGTDLRSEKAGTEATFPDWEFEDLWGNPIEWRLLSRIPDICGSTKTAG